MAMDTESNKKNAPLAGAYCDTAGHRRTKIVVTVGPASRSPERLRALMAAGANVFRLNFSHGSHEQHLEVLERVRTISRELQRPVAVLQDLCGPKIRISPVEGDSITLNDNEEVWLRQAKADERSTAKCILIELLNPVEVLRENDPVLLADGLIELRCEALEQDHVRCKVIKGGKVLSRVGIAFPDSHVDLPATTKKDMVDLEWGIQHNIDYVAISFVKDAEDVKVLRRALDAKGSGAKIIAKIERKPAVDNLEAILEVSDGIMVARGDLGINLPLECVPLVQKRLIEQANNCGLPVIVATQMLRSMISSARPTRAEVSDVATAVLSGADAVMLSEETAIGENPVQCVRYLDLIAREVETAFTFEEHRQRVISLDRETVPDSVAYAAAGAASRIKAAAVVASTETGTSARLVAKYRPREQLFGVSQNEDALRRMALYWGVIPLQSPPSADRSEEISNALRAVQQAGGFENGALAVVTGGLAIRTPGATCVMQVQAMRGEKG